MYRRVLYGAPFAMLVAFAAVPAVWPVGAWIEGRVFPVATPYEITRQEKVADGVLFHVRFDKLRSCQFLGIQWYRGARRIVLDLEPDSDKFPKSRPAGAQEIGPWLLRGEATVDGTWSIVQHRCHPLWVTETLMYGSRP